jgi:hypothetical protein
VSAVAAYQREQSKLKRVELQRQNDSASEYVGKLGERSNFTVTFESSRVVSAGYTYNDPDVVMYKFKDEAGNILVWFTGSAPGDFSINGSGSKYSVRATVKRHQEYRGIKQTVVNRLNIVQSAGKD